MCGIFGIIINKNCSKGSTFIHTIMDDLFLYSESRGKEASGIAIKTKEKVHILKSGQAASSFIKSKTYSNLFTNIHNDSSKSPIALMGHSRLVTNGRNSLNINNQPVIVDEWIGIHNGIIVNDKDIWSKLSTPKKTELDTEALLALIADNTLRHIPIQAIQESFKNIEGNASIALMNNNSHLLYLASNNGSLYYWSNPSRGISVFASENFILSNILLKHNLISEPLAIGQYQVKANTGVSITIDSFEHDRFSWNEEPKNRDKSSTKDDIPSKHSSKIIDHSQSDYPDYKKIRRCTRCILPETFPSISFDAQGVCNYCHSYQYEPPKDPETLKKIIAPYSRKDGKPDCLVGLSGGRDSCYGLHYIKTVLKMNPIAYTYDWGLVTDLARRNIARICGELGVEHILISADIPKKRANIRKNINAWLKKPSLCMVPLFMAGDKQFYYYAHKLRQETGVDLFLFCAGNDLERTEFKTGFCGLTKNADKGTLTQLTKFNKLKLATAYTKEFIKNPSYINSSLFDSLSAFYSSYLLRDDYVYLYYYLKWNEQEVVDTLKNKYNWETAEDTQTTWRIGDGSAAFYNYIYYVLAGFTEHDTFRSNQIRAGMMTRENALQLVAQDNLPRWETLEWYAKTIGFNLDEALLTIHNTPKLY
ncbi:MAG: hypothetical protein OQL19_08040 [Gammaproteobacteria bacterium]|nr:hypothetical protein [Gammaproteobacteria bacterium]